MATDFADLKLKSVRSGAVTMISQAITIAIQLTSTVVLARLLSPNDYGTIAMVMAVTNFAGIFRDLGLSSAAIQIENLTRAQQSNLFWLNVGMGTLLTALVAAAAPLVVWFYGKSELLWLTTTLSLSFIIGSIGTQHGAILVRNFQFGRQAVATISGSIVALAAAVTFALQGFSYWALAWGYILGSLTTTVLLCFLSPLRPGWVTKGAGIRTMLKFGVNITASDVTIYIHRNLDNILIGRFWGAGQLGQYSRAYALLMLPITSIRGPINAVAFPTLSRLQSDPEAFRSYYLKTTSLIALLSMPMAAFFFVASKPIIELVLGRQWQEVSPLFACLALSAIIQPASGFAGSLMLSLGQGRRYLWSGICVSAFISICFLIGVQWGALGVAIAYTIGNYIILYPWLNWIFQESPVRFNMFLRACKVPVVVSGFGVAASLPVGLLIVTQHPYIQICGLAASFVIGSAIPLFLTAEGRRMVCFISKISGQLRDRSSAANRLKH
jgi:PST family polysaccharide transporter